MIAIDTNILVRFAREDNAAQIQAVKVAIGEQTIWVGHTVLLEFEWVMRAVYEQESADICTFIENMLNAEQFQIEQEARVRKALVWYAQGADFADALHLARMPEKAKFLTLDLGFCKAAKDIAKQVERIRAK